jgi:NADPH oxidase 2
MSTYFNKVKRSSGLDFSDRGNTWYPMEEFQENYGSEETQPGNPQWNKNERDRLQGLERSQTHTSVSSSPHGPYKPETIGDRWRTWMINEGGKRFFFSVWIFLHILVAVFGFMTYQMKDLYNNARSTFKLGFGK